MKLNEPLKSSQTLRAWFRRKSSTFLAMTDDGTKFRYQSGVVKHAGNYTMPASKDHPHRVMEIAIHVPRGKTIMDGILAIAKMQHLSP